MTFDDYYLNLVDDVLTTGELSKNRTGIDTLYKNGLYMEFDMEEGFPLLTTKRVPWKSAFGEMLGFIRGYTNAADFRKLGCKVWDCVPIHTTILTKRGILSYADVVIGDETIGYNPLTGNNEWTKITDIHYYEKADVVRLENSRYGVECTPNHKWVIEKRRTLNKKTVKSIEFIETNKLGKGSKSNIILSIPADTGIGLPISNVEAAVLGWIAGDGCVEQYVDRPRGRKRPSMCIMQTKVHYVKTIENLLKNNIPHSRYEKKRNESIDVTWRLNIDYSDDLINRVGHPKQNAVNIVLMMSSEQRKEWLKAIEFAEGDGIHIYQCEGPIKDAIKIALYLEGKRASESKLKKDHENWTACYSIKGCRPVFGRFNRKISTLDMQPVWCVSTEIGTWTAVQHGMIFLTGNSNANKNIEWLNNPNRKGVDDIGLAYGSRWRNWQTIYYSHPDKGFKALGVDQLQDVYEKLLNNIDDRRLIIEGWNPAELHLQALPVCHKTMQFSLRNNKQYLDLFLHVRSNDIGLGMPFNVAQYAWLLHLMAKITNHKPGKLCYFAMNYHIYVNHIDALKEQLTRIPKESPEIMLSNDVADLNFLETTELPISDWTNILNYNPYPSIKMEMAV